MTQEQLKTGTSLISEINNCTRNIFVVNKILEALDGGNLTLVLKAYSGGIVYSHDYHSNDNEFDYNILVRIKSEYERRLLDLKEQFEKL